MRDFCWSGQKCVLPGTDQFVSGRAIGGKIAISPTTASRRRIQRHDCLRGGKQMAETRTALNGKIETEQTTRRSSGLEFERRFTDGRVSPYDTLEWERRTAQIGNDKGQ